MCWVYLKSYEKEAGKYLYTVGFYSPNGEWHSIEDFSAEINARQLVNYLNGG